MPVLVSILDGGFGSEITPEIVIGVPEWTDLEINLPLRADGDRRHRTIIDRAEGKYALTRCRTLEKFTHHALIEVTPETGRTHQIRAHLATIGFPIAGDEFYGAPKNDRGLINRSALHARSITLKHPITHQAIQIDAPYPIDFDSALKVLRK